MSVNAGTSSRKRSYSELGELEQSLRAKRRRINEKLDVLKTEHKALKLEIQEHPETRVRTRRKQKEDLRRMLPDFFYDKLVKHPVDAERLGALQQVDIISFNMTCEPTGVPTGALEVGAAVLQFSQGPRHLYDPEWRVEPLDKAVRPLVTPWSPAAGRNAADLTDDEIWTGLMEVNNQHVPSAVFALLCFATALMGDRHFDSHCVVREAWDVILGRS